MMLYYAKVLLSIIIGLGSGAVISGAVFAFIAVIGVVPRLAQKTGTTQYIKLYEEALIVGGVFGCCSAFYDIRLNIGKLAVIFFSFCVGVFFGCIAVSLAEVLDVIPILSRRARMQQGMFFFVIALALGKMVGALLYFFVPGFYTN